MVRTQIQLPDELHKRAKRFSREREVSLAELTRRGLELLLDRYPAERPGKSWKLPRIQSGLRVPLEKLHEVAADEEAGRGLPRR